MTKERIRFAWVSSCCLLFLNRRRVVPLYTWVDARRFTESRGRLINVSGSVSTLSILQHKLYINVGLPLQALIRLWALGLHKAPSSLSSWASNRITHYGDNPASPGRFMPNSNIPNIRPQVDLNLFMSIFIILIHTELHSCEKAPFTLL